MSVNMPLLSVSPTTLRLFLPAFGSRFNPETREPDPSGIAVVVPEGPPVGRRLQIRMVTLESEATKRHAKTPVDRRLTLTLTPRGSY